MSDSDRLRLLRAQLEDDYQFIDESARRHTDTVVRARHAQDDEMATTAVAYLVHNVYTAFEGYFLRVAKHFENSLDDAAWHKELIDRMKIAIPGIRPALITPDLVEPLDELRRFRHLFRNMYKSRLRKDRVNEVSEIASQVVQEFEQCHKTFADWIDTLLAAEDTEG
ncbi:MAG: hypothetical protein EA428_00315 [Spirochaetaceae bacterium]|nr:MAG: hypothetical protein EA428_00315 [Spirochaetaceae bacterium]